MKIDFKTISLRRLGVVLLIMVLSIFVLSLLVSAQVKKRLYRLDSRCTFEGIDYGFNAIVIRNLEMPGLGVSSTGAYILTGGSLFHPAPLYVVLQGVVFQPEQSAGSSGSVSMSGDLPAISVLDGTIPLYSTEFRGSRIHGVDTGHAGGQWGEITAVRCPDSISVVFSRCTEVPGREDAFPDFIRGHSVSGRFSGVLQPETSISGVVTEMDGEQASVAFDYSLVNGEPSAALSMDFSQIALPAMAFVDSISSGAVLSVSPSGSLSVNFSGGDSIFFSTDLCFDSLSIWNASIAPDTFSTTATVYCRGFVLPEAGVLVVDTGAVCFQTLSFDFNLAYYWGTRHKLGLVLSNPTLQGETITESIPEALLGSLSGLSLEGEMSLFARLTLDWDYPDSSDIDMDIDVCRLSVDYSPVVFGRISNSSGANCVMRDSWGNSARIGLDTLCNADFVVFDSLPLGFEPLLRCAEDASFRRHHGFSLYHIRNSIRANMAEGHFVRGGSTITMQLAKNLFLGREKTFARKLQEVFLTWRLERWLSKDRILEIYANIVELGPGVFGFNSAAMYYFNERACDLSVRETSFLVSMLPGPRLYHRYAVQGVLPSYWKSYVERLITICGNRGWLEEYVVSEAVADTLIFDGAVSLL
ncbi:MAG: transglycosylase domain-containing protein [Candidatus Fermentibacteraceae bacterium]|nr:transglycosylase domain-containing protein [Candidatus Fermentibacteraceae bacterium]